ncbi:MAG TPA: ATP-binding protein [Rhizomicrobium sp.]
MTKTVEKLLRQQAALADFGSFAFRETDLQLILNEAARICAASLEVPFAKICRYRAPQNDLLVVAAWGWREGVVGHVVSTADESSTQGRAFVTGKPVILKDLAQSTGYALPAVYAEHGIVATVDVLIKGCGTPWGVLEVDSTTVRKFDRHDIVFLTGFANILADAAAMTERTTDLLIVIDRTKSLLAQKEKLLEERRDRERRLHDLQAELLRVARLNVMGQMTAAIAHEVNQPLAAIANYISAAQRTLQAGGPDAAARAHELIDKAAGQTTRAGDIIKNLRSFVEKREGVRTSEDLPALIERSLALANYNALEEDIAVTLRLDAGLPPVTIDVVQVQQILVNLIRNSVEAMRPLEKRELLIVAAPGEAGFATVTVQDTGPGLPPDVLEKLFLPFVTTKDSGMGLGLSICEVLVKANGGRISLVEGLAEGTGFCFSLPLARAA